MAFGVDINETLYKHLSPVLEQKIHSYLSSSVVDPDPVIGYWIRTLTIYQRLKKI
jgi:hypothetical protein